MGRYENNGSLLAEVMGPGTGRLSLLMEREHKEQSRFQLGKIGAMVHWNNLSSSNHNGVVSGPKIRAFSKYYERLLSSRNENSIKVNEKRNKNT